MSYSFLGIHKQIFWVWEVLWTFRDMKSALEPGGPVVISLDIRPITARYQKLPSLLKGVGLAFQGPSFWFILDIQPFVFGNEFFSPCFSWKKRSSVFVDTSKVSKASDSQHVFQFEGKSSIEGKSEKAGGNSNVSYLHPYKLEMVQFD